MDHVNNGFVLAACPTGKVPIGGGYPLPNGFTTQLAVTNSYPTATEWAVGFNVGASTSIAVYAICATSL